MGPADHSSPSEAIIDDRYLLSIFLDTTPDHVYFKDTESRFTRISQALAHWMGLDCAQEAVGRTDFDFFADEHASKAFADEQRIIRTGEPSIGQEEREVWPDGRVTWVSTTKVPLRGPGGEVLGIFGLSRDITDRRLVAERLAGQSLQLEAQAAQLEQLTLGDELTGLNNRRGLHLLGGNAVDRARRDGSPLCVLFLDLDGLKSINDSMGHSTGDQILVEAAEILRKTVRIVDIVGRIGGDEFAVVCADTSRAEAEHLADRLRRGANASRAATRLSLSVGIAVLGEHGVQTLDALIDIADRAMYEEKRRRPAA